MIGHAIALSGMFAAATALLLYSTSLPPDENIPVIANGTPEPVVSASVAPDVDVTPTPVSSGENTVVVVKETPAPTPTPTAKPTEAPLPSYNIAATTPQSVLRQAQVHAGRTDPFKSVYPPDLPDFEPAITANQLVLPSAVPLPVSGGLPPTTPSYSVEPTPAPAPLTRGLKLSGIMDGGVDPVAIISVNGNTNLYRTGEVIQQKNIKVVSIDYDSGRVTLSRGMETAALYLPKPKVPNF